MCCKDIQGHGSVTATRGACQSGAREMCGCEEKPGSHAMPMRHGTCHSDNHETCGCGEHKLLSKEERIEKLEEYRESLKRKLDGVEEELKVLKEE
jgi:hypothetical protein